MKFTLSPTQEINLANKGLVYQNGKAVFDKETETELKSTIKKALAEKDKKWDFGDLEILERTNFKQEQKTIFSDNKTFSEVLFEGLIFAFGSCVFLTIVAGLLIAFINLLNY